MQNQRRFPGTKVSGKSLSLEFGYPSKAHPFTNQIVMNAI
ncbi:hypothetical protein HMPREF0497_1002 [Lentilactobacillus buchneri ATCC 11577]|jgi:hypothetical protein|nr:hypothetical protein HMPREF0497_1002 [Lentilactobacillus buchneri ATCC 11577]